MDIKKVNNWLFNTLKSYLPNPCLLCDKPSSLTYALCESCQQELPALTHCCSICATPLEPTQHDLICGLCLHKARPFSRISAPFIYEDNVSRLIYRLKYQHQLLAADILGQLLMQHIQANPPDVEIDAIIPMPSHRLRIFLRGFNQANELAKPMSRKWGIPRQNHWVKRIKYTQKQTQLSALQRTENLQGAFKVVHPVEGLHLAIVDDVVTTTASVEGLANALLQAGAAHVEIWALARTPSKHDLIETQGMLTTKSP